MAGTPEDGRRGVAHAFDPETFRWDVLLDGSETMAQIPAANLQKRGRKSSRRKKKKGSGRDTAERPQDGKPRLKRKGTMRRGDMQKNDAMAALEVVAENRAGTKKKSRRHSKKKPKKNKQPLHKKILRPKNQFIRNLQAIGIMP